MASAPAFAFINSIVAPQHAVSRATGFGASGSKRIFNMLIRFSQISILLIATALAGCSDSKNKGSTEPPAEKPTPQENFKPQGVAISSLRLVDAAGQPLSGVSIAVIPAPAGASALDEPPAKADLADTALSDGSGDLAVQPLAPGSYWIQLVEQALTAATLLTIDMDNGQSSSIVALPVLLKQDDVLQAIDSDAFVASVNGLVYDAYGPVEGAQVALSAGEFSNGAIASTVTNSAGEYFLVLNVGGAVVPALNNVSVQVVAPDYETISLDNLDISEWGTVAGFNSQLVAGAASGEVVYREDFDDIAEGAVCGSWAGMDMSYLETGNLWNSHGPGRGIVNQAIEAELVSLAPDDTSQGYVPDPSAGNACWYGDARTKGIEGGNFLGAAVDNGDGTFGGEWLDGGTSEYDHAAAIVSPIIDLTNEQAPLALVFDTWWEIEAVNPNEDGFDLMSIEVLLEGEDSWHVLARLNPLSDPATLTNDLPYSNRGFNKAPAWLWQEPIPLDQFAGKRVQLRLAFYTEDDLYNGFRGWLVDNVEIVRQKGTFPLWEEYSFSDDPLQE